MANDTDADLVSAQRAAPTPVLSVFDAVMIAVGIVIGAGIFKTPALVAGLSGSVEAMIAAWVAGGLLSLIGALTYAELASTFPSAGGDYSFLTRAFGRHLSFFFAWARVMVITTGSIALLGFVLGDYLSQIVRLGPHSDAIYAACAVCVLTAINLSGLKASSRVQNTLTLIEIAGVLLVAAAGLLSSAPPAAPASATAAPGMFGAVMVFVLLTYGGWNDVAYVSAEVKGGRRSIMRALVISILLIAALYVFFVLAVLHGLGWEGLQASEALGADVMQRAFGPGGAQLISVIVGVTALTSMNGTMIVGARTNYALGKDWPLFHFMSRWRSQRNTPVAGFMVQAAVALVLVGVGALERDGFASMVEFTAPVFWFFFMLSGVALFVLRARESKIARPFSVPFYPVLPGIFVLTCAYLFYSSIAYARSQRAAYVAVLVMAVGAIVWVIACLRRRPLDR